MNKYKERKCLEISILKLLDFLLNLLGLKTLKVIKY